ncbi:hypothetical protein ACIA8F_12730 [Streptomyces sp. NPDC051563]
MGSESTLLLARGEWIPEGWTGPVFFISLAVAALALVAVRWYQKKR